MTPVNIGLFAHEEDEQFKHELLEHVKQLEHVYNVQFSHEIMPGEGYYEKLQYILDNSHIIVLLLSSAFLHSEYYYQFVIKQAARKKKDKRTPILPVLIRQCLHDIVPELANTIVLPSNGVAIASAENKDEAYKSVAKGLQACIDVLLLDKRIRELEAENQQLKTKLEVFINNTTK